LQRTCGPSYASLPFQFNKMYDDGFLMQKYERQTGFYALHHDFQNDLEHRRHRTYTYLWYLNTVAEGGRTKFPHLNHMAIAPTQGSLLLFPATWTHVHEGEMPVSEDKYICTGWFYAYDD
jgi:hypothetical protein